MKKALLLIAILLAAPVHAERWASEAGASSLRFTASYDGAPFDGAFPDFSVQLEAPAGTLDEARLTVTIELATVDTENAERDETLAESDWFATASHPSAHYLATSFEAAGPARWRARGELTLKGVTRVVPVDFELRPIAGDVLELVGALRMRGDAIVDRLAFGVGSGDWSDPDLIAHEVEVRFDVRLVPAD